MKVSVKVARAIARTTLSDVGKKAFDSDLQYYLENFSQSERDDFDECAAVAIEAVQNALND